MLKEMGFYKGVNLGGWFSQCDYSKERLDGFITEKDFAQIAAWGFDHVRIPIDYNVIQNRDGSMIEEGLRRIDRALALCEKYGLHTVLDLHKTQGFSFDAGEKETGFFQNEAYQEKFYTIWDCFARRWGDRETVERIGIDELVRLYVKFHEEAEKDPSLEDLARAEFHKLEEGDPDNLALWKWFCDVSLAEYAKTYRQLGIDFDAYTGESFYMDKMGPEIDRLRDMGLLKLDDGAQIVDLSEYNMPPCIILKRDGSTIYHTRDIAAAVYRKKTYDFDKAIYVTSAQQCLHFAQLKKVLELMGYEWAENIVHIPYGTVSVDGAKLATRTGNVVLLKDLFRLSIEKVRELMDEKNPDLENKDEVAEAVGVGAIVFNYLYNSRIKDINFVLDQALSFDGSTGPYAQYTYARTCSILEKAKAAGIEGHGGALTHPSEEELLKTL